MTRAIRVPASVLVEVARELPPADRREMAVPSYIHWNPAIRWLFWDRLDTAVRLARVRPDESVFEFGSGTGILLPTHHALARRVVCTDLHLEPSRRLAARYALPTEQVRLEELTAWADRNAGALDCVYALDCLDHVSDEELRSLIPMFARLLSARGRLIICGPTESAPYRVGRFLAGFRNEYHHRNIFDIDRLLRDAWVREEWVGLPRPPMPRGFWVGRYVPRRG